jgi:phosphatidylserine/phosphatidylglycerophosphate/cardiolipin synthase-like enzyme
MTITPLLTPDNYGKNMLFLIQLAKKSLYIQTQYIHLPKKQSPSDLITLLTAVRDKMEAGVDVRIILSEWENAPSLDALKSFGINTSLVKLQNGVHNKGFVIDSSIVALGSQNWSVQGSEQNRDASLIIQHEGVAQYYEQIFMHDWTKMAAQHLNLG